MNSKGASIMTKTEIKALKIRIEALKAEREDPTCRRFPTARMHVTRELRRAQARLRRAVA